MSIHIPMIVTFRVIRASMSSELEMQDGLPQVNNSLNLVLLAEGDTKIHLSSGEPLSKVQVHFSLSSKWRTPTELDRDLAAQEVGFLCHSREQNGSPFVHGAALWPDELLPQYLLGEHLLRRAQLTVASLPMPLESKAPHSWATNREHFLRLSSIHFNGSQE